MKHVDAVVGNSSSGILEAPSMKIPTINIGDRQDGRIKAKSVIDCEPNRNSIKKAFKTLSSAKFCKSLVESKNPYGDGGAVNKTMKILKSLHVPKELKKEFYNL